MPRYKLYTYTGEESVEPALVGRNGLLPRVCTASDEDAIEWARAMVSEHKDICCFELVRMNSEGTNGPTVCQQGQHL